MVIRRYQNVFKFDKKKTKVFKDIDSYDESDKYSNGKGDMGVYEHRKEYEGDSILFLHSINRDRDERIIKAVVDTIDITKNIKGIIYKFLL